MSTAFDYRREPHPNPRSAADRAAILASPGFGREFTDHMFLATWTAERDWHDGRLVPYGPLSLEPATAVLHYAQEIFEGLKAYAHADSSTWLFRPDRSAKRMQSSAARMAMPALPADWFMGSLQALLEVDNAWVPQAEEASLYLRPFMFASQGFLGVSSSAEMTYGLIASPAGPYFSGGIKPISIWLSSHYTRSAPGGTGAVKAGANYAISLLPQQEANEQGCDQVVFLDAVQMRWVEELGGMNIFFVRSDGTIVTPELTGTFLEGITRDSILVLAKELGHDVLERPVSIDEWREGVADGSITEIFACGTAAAITPIGTLKFEGGEVVTGNGEPGEVTLRLRSALVDLQYGRQPDTHGWMHRIA